MAGGDPPDSAGGGSAGLDPPVGLPPPEEFCAGGDAVVDVVVNPVDGELLPATGFPDPGLLDADACVVLLPETGLDFDPLLAEDCPTDALTVTVTVAVSEPA